MRRIFFLAAIVALCSHPIAGSPGAALAQTAVGGFEPDASRHANSSCRPLGAVSFDWQRNARTTEFGLVAGLPSLSIEDLEYDAEGRLWVATAEGLAIYDGLRFERIEPRPPLPGSGAGSLTPTAPNFAHALVRARSGGIWVGTGSGRLMHYASPSARPLVVHTGLDRIAALLEAHDGSIWASGSGVVRLTGGVVTTITTGSEQPEVLARSLAQRSRPSEASLPQGDSDDYPIWIGGGRGLSRWTPSAGLEAIDTIWRQGVFFDSSDRRWEILGGGHLMVDGERWGRLPDRGGALRDAQELSEGRILLLMGTGSWILDHRDHSIVPTLENSNGSQRACLTAGARGLWIARDPVGLELIEPKPFTTFTGKAPGHQIFPVAALPGGLVGFSSNVQQSLCLAKATPRADGQVSFEDATRDWGDLGSNTVLHGAAELPDGSSVLATSAGPLRLRDGILEALEPSRFPCHLVAAAEGGAIWFENRNDLVEFQGGARTGRVFRSLPGRMGQLHYRDGQLLASAGSRLVELNRTSMEVTVLADIGDSTIRSFSVDRPSAAGTEGTIWIASYGGGLFRRASGSSLENWSINQGLPSRYLGWIGRVPGPTEDTHLWMNSNAGTIAVRIDSLDGDRLHSTLIPTGEANGPGGVAQPNGVLLLPTMEGPVGIDTAHHLEEARTPRLSLAPPLANGLPIDPEAPPLGVTDVQFPFSAVAFPRVDRFKVEFRLEGHDADWIDAQEVRAPRYTNLAPGDYQFELRASGPSGLSGPVLEGDTLHILAEWHQRPMIRLSGVLLALGALALGVRSRVTSLKARNSALETEVQRRELAEQKSDALRRQVARAEESERSRVARELHDDFSQRLVALGMSLRFTAERSDPTPEATVAASLEDAIADTESLAEDLHSLSRRLHPTVLEDLGLGAALRSECHYRGGDTIVTIAIDEDLHSLRGDTGLALYRVAQEALLNSSKHACPQRIDVTLRKVASGIELSVMDDGSGMDVTTAPGAGSVGIASMRERMSLVGGSLALESAPDEGTIVRALAPFPQSSPQA